jgi:ferrous iron transport protein B
LPESCCLVALVGNPNVGKSTVFNGLTGLNQHTGNWPGKTVDLFEGMVTYNQQVFRLVDLPGTYSLRANSREEEITRDFIINQAPDVTVCVVDATSLERNLNLVLQVIPLARRCIICLNLMDEAREKGISINVSELERELGVPVVSTAARKNMGLSKLMETIYRVAQTEAKAIDGSISVFTNEEVEKVFQRAGDIVARVVTVRSNERKSFTDKLDDIVTSRRFGLPIMLFLLCLVFSITLYLANYPSRLISWFLFSLVAPIESFLTVAGSPLWSRGLLVDGVYRTVAWVTSVMLPPMAIFFPIWTLLEDFGYLPRAAFNLDHLFQKNGGHGKQALTMSMGFGCNAAGVVACRIIESPRERLIAILTNTFVPCNGRFPTLIMISAIFFTGAGFFSWLPGLMVMALVLLGVGTTLLVSRVLSRTILKGIPSSFVLELPPYRKPDIWRVIVRSWKDRTIWVLRRAVTVAAPCGAIMWLLANTYIDGVTLISKMAGFLEPVAVMLGLDGVILTAFILGFPANEIVLPVALMSYLSQRTMVEVQSLDLMGSILRANGWTWTTALSVLIFSLLHYPCGTTVYTIYKETNSTKWAFLSILVPTVTGVIVLFVLNSVLRLVGL